MKGDNVRNICLRFLGLGICDECQAYVKIIDCNNCIVYDGNTYSGELSVCLNTCSLYHLIAVSLDEKIDIYFYVDKCRNNYYFYFPRSIIIEKIITFQLMDLNYQNLMIEKGEIILWKK